MSYPEFVKIILGNIEKAGIDVKKNEVVIHEIKEMRDENFSTFYVILMRGGITWDLGLWKINMITGKIEGFLPDAESNLENFDWLRAKISFVLSQERLLISEYSPYIDQIEKLASLCDAIDSFFFPINYIHRIISNILHSFNLWRFSPDIRFSRESISLFQRMWDNLSIKRSNTVSSERETIHRISIFLAVSERMEEVNEKNVEDAFYFYEAIHYVLHQLYEPQKSINYRSPDNIRKDSTIIQVFKNWTPFNKLSQNNQNARNLIMLIIKMARLLYVCDRFNEEMRNDLLKRLGLG